MNCVEKILIVEIADTDVLVGCDVGRIERAEWQVDSEAARNSLPSGAGRQAMQSAPRALIPPSARREC